MSVQVHPIRERTAIPTDLVAIFVSMELSRAKWLITSLSPGAAEKMSKHAVVGGDLAGLLARFAQLQDKARARTGKTFPIIVIQEAKNSRSSCIRCSRPASSSTLQQEPSHSRQPSFACMT